MSDSIWNDCGKFPAAKIQISVERDISRLIGNFSRQIAPTFLYCGCAGGPTAVTIPFSTQFDNVPGLFCTVLRAFRGHSTVAVNLETNFRNLLFVAMLPTKLLTQNHSLLDGTTRPSFSRACAYRCDK
jgi:hypothetical protein